MANDRFSKHPRGSSPPPAQHVAGSRGNGEESDVRFIEQAPDNGQTDSPARLTALAPPAHEDQDDEGRWQDDGGEGG